ncbi:hypothetical protein ANN_14829 [Periplaneta americana]|uniref:Uncharacterized protein n=1 Tax=Periplaneta americana TaxID=6978 RepID=A0ABQ8SYL0_PERAM|nr:hypothetical protein ANN_14829 [Periplaneta americana]
MAGLCEGGNERPGSLIAICKNSKSIGGHVRPPGRAGRVKPLVDSRKVTGQAAGHRALFNLTSRLVADNLFCFTSHTRVLFCVAL